MATIDNYIAALIRAVKEDDKERIEEAVTSLKEFVFTDPDADEYLVNDPVHYQSMAKGIDIDCITAMRAAFGDEEVKVWCKLNAFKYIWRSASKGKNLSIKKAMWNANEFLQLGGYNE